jgi:type IV secretion system protein VirD4
MGDKEFETAVQTYTGALQGYAEAARAKPKKTRFGGRARSSDAKARG